MKKQRKGVRLEHISKIYTDPRTGEELYTVQDVTLDIEPESFVTPLEPSGYDKTATLRMITESESPDEGDIYLGDGAVSAPIPSKGDTAMVFQSYILLPRYNVFDNVAYGLKICKFLKEEIHERVTNILRLAEVGGMGSRMTNQLSGDQQQRVILIRAPIIEFSALLFDEPLNSPDAKLRVTTRTEIRKIQQEIGITVTYVIHDQSEATSTFDKVIIMSKGKMEQIGTLREAYYHPNSRFVADSIGEANFLEARIRPVSGERAATDVAGQELTVDNFVKARSGDDAVLTIRLEGATLAEQGLLEGIVTLSISMGSYQYYQVMVGSMETQTTDYNPVSRRIYEIGEKTHLDSDPKRVHIPQTYWYNR